jgi:hypothetical protein
MMTRTATVLGILGLLVGCAERRSPTPITLTISPAGMDTRVAVKAAAGLKINARLKPALEMADGMVLRFDSPQLTPDSAYFAEPPSALLAGCHDRVRGTLHASVCGVNEQVCRSVTVQLD